MNTIRTIQSIFIPMPQKNIDTDQIIPARYLKVTDKASVAEGLFADWRFNPDGTKKDEFILNRPGYQKAEILLAGDNFGCGSSREHAPWALAGWGIKAIISTSFADIFKNNALKNGLLTITVDEKLHRSLFDLAEREPNAELHIDLETQTLSPPGRQPYKFAIDPFAKRCLLTGVDQLNYILSFEDQIKQYELNREAMIAS